MIYNGSTIYNEGAGGGGGSSDDLAVFTGMYNPDADPADYSGLPDQADVLAAINEGKDVVLMLMLAANAPYLIYRLGHKSQYGNQFLCEDISLRLGSIRYRSFLWLSYAGPDNPWTWSGGKIDISYTAEFTYRAASKPSVSDIRAEREAGKAVFLVCGEDVQVGNYWLEKGTVLPLTLDTQRPGYATMSLEFACTGVFKGQDCVTVRCVVNGDDTWEWYACDTAAVKNGGALTDAASVNVPNNALSTLSTAQAALTLNVNVRSGELPNFAVEIIPSVDVTLTVTKTVDNTTTTLNPSAAGGNSLTAGKLYQVTCVGNCWTLAEFEVPV